MKNIYYHLLLLIFFIPTNYSYATQPVDYIPKYETFIIESKIIGEDRTINVWVPEGYKTNSDSLPVMYMTDGGVDEDFPHIANTLSELIIQNRIKPLILVGIENTQRRRDLTGFTEVEEDKEIAPVIGGAEKFRTFIKDELFPEINNRYKTTNEKSIIGESLSGLFVIETFLLTPEMFNNYIAFDPSLWWNNNYLVRTAKEHLEEFPSDEKRIWFAGSNTIEISPSTKKLATILETENRSNIKWEYTYEPKETHSTIFRATKEKALIWILNKPE